MSKTPSSGLSASAEHVEKPSLNAVAAILKRGALGQHVQAEIAVLAG
jgi:hypothetical protein